MKVVNKNEYATGFLTVNDLDAGEVFRFKDETRIYLMSDDCYAVDVETGEVCYTDVAELEYRPVERVSCHLVID